jgi:hypothetical protein
MKSLLILAAFLSALTASAHTPTAPFAAPQTWLPRRSHVIHQITIQLKDQARRGAHWTRYAQDKAGWLKALNVDWQEFSIALHNSARWQEDLGMTSPSRATYESTLANAAADSLRDFRRASSRSNEILGKRVYAVHSTDYFPKDGVIRLAPVNATRPLFRPTVHFALGGLVRAHHTYTWENKRYAVLTPLETLYPQLINLFVYDSFAIGDVKIGPRAILLVPESERGRASIPEGEVRYVDPGRQTLRQAIEATLSSVEAWNIDAVETTDERALAFVDGVNVNTPEFFEDVLKANPGISFGSHSFTAKGALDPSLVGLLDLPQRDMTDPNYVHARAIDSWMIPFAAPLAIDQIRKRFDQTPLLAEMEARFALSQKVDPTPGGTLNDPFYSSSLINFYAQFRDRSTADRLLKYLGPLMTTLNAEEHSILYGIRHSLIAGEFDETQALSLLQRLRKAPNARLLTKIVVDGFSQHDEESIQSDFSVPKAGLAEHLKWVALLAKHRMLDPQWAPLSQRFYQPTPGAPAGLSCVPHASLASNFIPVDLRSGTLYGTHFFTSRAACEGSVARSKNGLICTANGAANSIPTRISDGQPASAFYFISHDACLEAVERSTPDLICGFHGNSSELVMVAHRSGTPLSLRRFPTLQSCLSLINEPF